MAVNFFKKRKSLQSLAVYEGVMIAIAIGIGIIQGRVSTYTVGSNLAILGLLLIAFALVSVFGAWGSTRSFNYQHASSAGPESIYERFLSNQRDMQESFGFFGSSVIIGLLSIVIGVMMFFL